LDKTKIRFLGYWLLIEFSKLKNTKLKTYVTTRFSVNQNQKCNVLVISKTNAKILIQLSQVIISTFKPEALLSTIMTTQHAFNSHVLTI
jgi:hypothetical protein